MMTKAPHEYGHDRANILKPIITGFGHKHTNKENETGDQIKN